jgi:hypothetical protein
MQRVFLFFIFFVLFVLFDKQRSCYVDLLWRCSIHLQIIIEHFFWIAKIRDEKERNKLKIPMWVKKFSSSYFEKNFD